MFIALFVPKAPSERNRLGPGRTACRVSLLMERDPLLCVRGYKHLAPLERKKFHR
jgi:hypothetical protein